MEGKQAQALTVQAEVVQAEVTPGYDSASGFDLLQRGAQALSASSMVPDAYKGDVANCIVALEMALRMRVSPMLVMQNLHIIKGKPSWSSAFLIGSLNGSQHYEKVTYRMFGEKGKDERGCVASTVDKSTGEVIEGPDVTIAIAKADGWWSRKDSKWPRMPELMLRYRAGAWLVRTVAPEMCMGFPDDNEALDAGNVPGIVAADVVVEPGAPEIVEAEEQKPKRRAARKPKPAEDKPPEDKPPEIQPNDPRLAAYIQQQEEDAAKDQPEQPKAPEPVPTAAKPAAAKHKSPF